HLDAIENLRQGIGLRGYGQKDPLVEYKNEGYKMFEQLMAAIDDEIVHRIYKIQIQQSDSVHAGPAAPSSHPTSSKKSSATPADFSGRSMGHPPLASPASDTVKKKLGRNDPCPCGAKKPDGTPIKYKHCHYPN
ncbi:MAG: preprotein translocase subunit SecA, partial [bacterium]|nr:preprotein translocase subunit SecA [bacterium]